MIYEAVIIVKLGAFTFAHGSDIFDDRGRVNGNAVKALVVLLFN